MTKKIETSIHRANGGNHSPVNYRKHKNMLSSHPYKRGYLYHIVLTGSEDRKVYRKAVELLCKELRKNGMPCRYKACYERDKFKRFHMHVFILIEAKDFHPDTIIHYRKGHWFTEMLDKLGLAFKIAQPQDPMHHVAGKKVNYAYVPKKASAKLDDCLVWISYLTKVRSKEGVEGQIYTGSTNREPKKPSLPSAAPTAAKEANTQSKETQRERIVQAQTSASSETSSYGTSESSACSPAHACSEAVAHAGRSARSGGEAQGEASPSIEPQRYSDSRATAPIGRAEMTLTAAQKYVGSIYEQAVDLALDLEAMRRYLLDRGIKRTPLQIDDDLESVFGFYGYAASHPPKPMMSVREWDRSVEKDMNGGFPANW
jgi:hypothetical protein